MRACASPVVVMDSSKQPLAVLDAGAAQRRRGRRLRAMLRHERPMVAMALAEANHHIAHRNRRQPGQPTTLRGARRPVWPGLQSASRCLRRSLAGQGQTGLLPSGCRRCRRGRGRPRLQRSLLCRNWQHKRWERRSRRFQGSPVGQEDEAESLTRNVPCSTNSVKRVGREGTWRRQVAE